MTRVYLVMKWKKQLLYLNAEIGQDELELVLRLSVDKVVHICIYMSRNIKTYMLLNTFIATLSVPPKS